jgi:porphobilinogen deaminase
MIQLGIIDQATCHRMAKIVTRSLDGQGTAYTVVKAATAHELACGIASGELDVAVVHLPDVPLLAAWHDAPGVVITAALERIQDPYDVIRIHQNSYQEGQLFHIPAGAEVSVMNRMQAIQIQAYRPDVRVLSDYLPENLSNSAFAAAWEAPNRVVIVSESLLEELEYPPVVLKLAAKLHPTEWALTPGQGAYVCLAHADNLPVRRLCKTWHHAQTAHRTNVERRIAQLCGPDAGAFCQHDTSGNFHLYAALFDGREVHRAMLSSSTHLGLGERMAQRLLAQ